LLVSTITNFVTEKNIYLDYFCKRSNPPELRELGQVVTEIGVAIVRPAEFVIFRISQLAQTS
jgi:phage tail sheath protein FI